MNVTTSSKPGHCQVGAFEIPLLMQWGMELRILPLGLPYPPAVITEQWVWLIPPCSEASFKIWRYLGEKTTLQQSWVQHPFALSVMAVTSCHSLPGSLTWKTNVVHFQVSSCGRMLSALWRLICYFKVPLQGNTLLIGSQQVLKTNIQPNNSRKQNFSGYDGVPMNSPNNTF